MSDIRILIGADIVPTLSNYELFREGNIEALCGSELVELMRSADYRILNLETPLTDQNTPIEKVGPSFSAPTDTVNGLRALGIDFLTLANNHILDQGEAGLASTVETLDKAGIAYSGVGNTLRDAATPFVVEIKGKRIGIYCCAEHEFSTATETSSGANPFDPLETTDQILNLREKCDYLICLYHGGKEHYRYPTPYLQKVCRKMVSKGADLVVCQHSHCIGCKEIYQGGTIVYGQGNFLADFSRSDFRQTALLIELNIRTEGIFVKYHPLKRTENGVCLALDELCGDILAQFQKRSNEIGVPSFIVENYSRYCKEHTNAILPLGGRMTNNIFIKILAKYFHRGFFNFYLKKVYAGKMRLAARNRIECETWREMVLKVLED